MNKFNARKRKFKGNTFDSTAELRRWTQLKKMEEAGEITDLSRQVKFVLIPSQRVMINEEVIKERECSYIADFVYTKDGSTVVEDVKGYTKGIAYDYYVIKRKLMLQRYGIAITEVR